MHSIEDFKAGLLAQISRAEKQGRSHVEVNAGELHRTLGGYPPTDNKNHSMPSCCSVMRDELAKGNAEVIHETDSGNSASLTIRYYLPR